jgi:hypothetical protein
VPFEVVLTLERLVDRLGRAAHPAEVPVAECLILAVGS